MIKSVYIDNFKSLVDFRIGLATFTCLIGLNGAGKSTVLQAVDFLAQLVSGDLDEWLKLRQWDRADLNSKLTAKSNIDFEIKVESLNFGEITWGGSVNRRTLNCTSEYVQIAGMTFLRVEDGKCSLARIQSEREGLATAEPSVKTVERFPIVFDYQGSILSQLKESQLNPLLQELKEVFANIRSLDLLSPELLRSRTKSADGTLGLGGNRLSAFLHESGKPVQEKLNRSLKEVYAQLDRVETKSLRSGWKQLEITEDFGGYKLKTSARHMNDGMLRLLAVFAQLEAGSEFLLFDEIENGINPELIEFLIDHLVQSNHQVVVTTHSPMILNFLETDVARKGVVYLYKNKQGYTKAKRFFEIPSLSEKLQFMGPGEAFVDTDLKALAAEIATLNKADPDQ